VATRRRRRVALPGRNGDEVALYVWDGLLNGDVGEAVEVNAFADKTFFVHGTAGAGLSAKLQGDSSEAGDQFYNLKMADGSAVLSLTSTPSGETVLDHPRRVRPSVTGDGTTNVTALLYIVARK